MDTKSSLEVCRLQNPTLPPIASHLSPSGAAPLCQAERRPPRLLPQQHPRLLHPQPQPPRQRTPPQPRRP